MANWAKKLNWYTSQGPDPELVLCDEDFSSLEEIYGISLNNKRREELVYICNSYLHFRRAAINVTPLSEVRRLFERLKSDLEPFISFATGSLLPDRSDAGAELIGIIEDSYSERSFCVLPEDVQFRDDHYLCYGDRSGIAFRLSTTTVQQFAFCLAGALDRVGDEITTREVGAEQGFQQDSQFNMFLLRLRDWAKQHGFRHGPFLNDGATVGSGTPSPFARFLFELNHHFRGGSDRLHTSDADAAIRDRFFEPVSSSKAMAERLKNAVRNRNLAIQKRKQQK